MSGNDEEQQGLLRSTSEVQKGRSRILLYLFLTGAVAALVVGIVFATVTYIKSHPSEDDAEAVSTEGVSPRVQTAARANSFRFAAIAPDARECATIGTELLASRGASAVDAMIATLLCNGLHNAHSLGVGGGLFMTIYDTPRNGTHKQFFILDSREVAPRAAHKDMFSDPATSPSEGPLSIAVPAQIAGLWAAWQRFGQVPWRQLFEPAIRLARDGIRVDPSLAAAISSQEDDIRSQPSLAEIFVHPNGSLVKEGDTIKRLKQADILEAIATEGGDSFYTGNLSEAVVAELRDIGSIVTAEDLKAYRPVWRQPIAVKLANSNLTLHTMPPPGGGLILSFILNILDGYKMRPEDLKSHHRKVLTYHHIIEAFKFAYAKRTLQGDPAFVDVSGLVELLTSSDYVAAVRRNITDWSTHDVRYYRPSFEPIVDGGTSHTSVLAPNGAAVASTSTINTLFGSLRRGSRTGTIFNNQMSDFSLPDDTDEWGLPPSEANFIEPGKRPQSSMSPTLITDSDDDVVGVIGASGGTKITTGVAYAFVHHLWLGFSIDEAISFPRLHHQLVPNRVDAESKFSKEVLRGLAKLGHEIGAFSGENVIQGISRRRTRPCDKSCFTCCIRAACDGRKDGIPDGY